MSATFTPAPVSDEMQDQAAVLSCTLPAIAKIVEGYMELATGTWTADQLSLIFAVLGGFGVGGDADLRALDAAVVQRLGDPATNVGLRELTPRRAQAIRDLTRQYAAYDADFAPRDLLAEAAGAADMHCPHPSD
uniref:hypothetical protein n=1 Tax=Streptomyces tubercidicus TaxID=47759 RepID=UPI0030E2B39F|nr:hypothetical protein OG690_38435 [Streptomyces tubercidicus]